MSDPSLRSGQAASSRAPSLIIVGTDALLAARPATPVQLAHACLALGFDGVVPASWGDELVAEAAMQHVSEQPHGPAVLSSCPHVARRMLQAGSDLQPFLVSLVSPPVAVARYLRTIWDPSPIQLTFVGHCAGANDASIDARITPRELLEIIDERGIVLTEQPEVFDEVIPPDRRRFHSLPGGAPAPDRLRACCGRELVELRGRELTTELAQYLLTESDVVLDAAASLGCACTGASMCATPRDARVAVAAIEPPRAGSPVLVPLSVPLSLAAPLPAPVPPQPPREASPPAPPPPEDDAETPADDAPADDAGVEVVRLTRHGRYVERALERDVDRAWDWMAEIEDVPDPAAAFADAMRDTPAIAEPADDVLAVAADHAAVEPPVDEPPAEAADEPQAEPPAEAAPEPARAAAPRRPLVVRRKPGRRPRHPVLVPRERHRHEASAEASAAADDERHAEPEPVPAEPAPETPASERPSDAAAMSTLAADEEVAVAPPSPELEELRATVERALQPFLASVEAMGGIDAAEASIDVSAADMPRARPAAPPVPAADQRRSDVAAAITVAREPDIVVAREPEVVARERVPQDAGETMRELGAGLAAPPRIAPTLKSIAAHVITTPEAPLRRVMEPRAAEPRRSSGDVVIRPERPRRWGPIAALVLVILVAIVAATWYLGFLDLREPAAFVR